jgi:hypothetical protein
VPSHLGESTCKNIEKVIVIQFSTEIKRVKTSSHISLNTTNTVSECLHRNAATFQIMIRPNRCWKRVR